MRVGDKVRFREPLEIIQVDNVYELSAVVRLNLGYTSLWVREEKLEVVESPLRVGDRVTYDCTGFPGALPKSAVIEFIGEECAVVRTDGGFQYWLQLRTLTRADDA